MRESTTEWPVSVRVGLIVPKLWRGGGMLSIAPGSISCRPGRFLARASGARDTKRESIQVDVYRAKLWPFDLTIPFLDDEEHVVVLIWLFSQRKVKRALRSAGFNVVEHVTWTDRGFRLADLRTKGSRRHSN